MGAGDENAVQIISEEHKEEQQHSDIDIDGSLQNHTSDASGALNDY